MKPKNNLPIKIAVDAFVNHNTEKQADHIDLPDENDLIVKISKEISKP